MPPLVFEVYRSNEMDKSRLEKPIRKRFFGGSLVELIEAGRTLIWPSSFRRGGIFSSRFPGWRGGGWSGHGCISSVFPRAKGIEIHWSLQLSSGVILTTQTSKLGVLPTTSGKWISWRRQQTTENRHCWGWQWTICLRARTDAFHGCNFGVVSVRRSNVWTVFFMYWGRQIIPFFKTEIETTSVPKKLQNSQRSNQTRRVPTKNRKQIVKCHHLKTTFAKQRYPPKKSCVKVYAEYQLREKSFWGYDVSVHNHAEEVAAPHKVHDSGKTLCAKAWFRRRADLVVAFRHCLNTIYIFFVSDSVVF